jgi:type I restriction-modification system DNA methylase subunit
VFGVNNGATLGIENKRWKAADKLRGRLDEAEYTSAVLGLIYPKYASEMFEQARYGILSFRALLRMDMRGRREILASSRGEDHSGARAPSK